MVIPVAGRSLAAVAGGALVIAAWASVIGTLIMPRRASGWVTRWTDRIVNRAFTVAAGTVADYRRRERVLVPQAATILIVQFVAWLGASFIGFTLLLWPFVTGGIMQALTVAGSSMSGVALSEPTSTVPPALLFAAAASGLVIIAPQIEDSIDVPPAEADKKQHNSCWQHPLPPGRNLPAQANAS